MNISSFNPNKIYFYSNVNYNPQVKSTTEIISEHVKDNHDIKDPAGVYFSIGNILEDKKMYTDALGLYKEAKKNSTKYTNGETKNIDYYINRVNVKNNLRDS